MISLNVYTENEELEIRWLTWLRRERIVCRYWRRRRGDSTFRLGNQKHDAILGRLQGRHCLFVCHILQIFIALLKPICVLLRSCALNIDSTIRQLFETLPKFPRRSKFNTLCRPRDVYRISCCLKKKKKKRLFASTCKIASGDVRKQS